MALKPSSERQRREKCFPGDWRVAQILARGKPDERRAGGDQFNSLLRLFVSRALAHPPPNRSLLFLIFEIKVDRRPLLFSINGGFYTRVSFSLMSPLRPAMSYLYEPYVFLASFSSVCTWVFEFRAGSLASIGTLQWMLCSFLQA